MGMFLITDNFIAVSICDSGGGGGGVEGGAPHGTHPHPPCCPVYEGEPHVPEAKYDGKVEVMDPFGTAAYQKVNEVGNLGEDD